MKEIVRDLPKILAVYVMGAVAILTWMVLVIAVPTVVSRITRPKVYEVTSPLEATVVQDLCQKLALSEDGPLCQPGAIVYAPDFFSAVRASFEPGVTTYDDVQEKLGSYQYKRGELITQADGTAYFVCDYDFNGDRVFPVSFFFTGDGVLERIIATVGDD